MSSVRLDPISQEASLRRKVKAYQKRAREIEEYLKQKPQEWGKFQSEFNQEIAKIFGDTMLFEKQHIQKEDEASIYKLKRIFINHIRKEFLRGEYIVWSFEKPYGYAGDFHIIDCIYRNSPKTVGFDRLFDNFFLLAPASIATRNRKEDFKKIIHNHLKQPRYSDTTVNVLDLASGPCRDILEFFNEYGSQVPKTNFFCYDGDERAIEFAKGLLGQRKDVTFVKENVVRLALRKDIENSVKERFDLIFSTGLFDYLDERVGVRLVANLRKLMKPGGLMVVSNYRDKYSNPAFHFMEWVGDWNLVYRTEEQFQEIFLRAGFLKEQLRFDYEQQGIMQYCFAQKSEI